MIRHIVTSSLLIAAIIGIRALVRRKVSPRLVYGLWLIVLIKLCLPLSLWSINLPQKTETPPPSAETTVSAPANSGFAPDTWEDIVLSPPPLYDNDVSALPTTEPNQYPAIQTEVPHSEATGGSAKLPQKEAPKIRIPEPKTIAITLWIIGASAVAAWFALSAAAHTAKLKKGRKFHGKRNGILVYVSPNAKTPCVAGFPPAIFLTSAAANSTEEKLVLAHETAHIRQLDPLWNIFRIAAVSVYWWNPLVWIGAKLSALDAEISCDDRVSLGFSQEERIAYAKTLVHFTPNSTPSVIGLGSGSLKERIKMLTNKPKKHIILAVTAVILALIVGGCSLGGIGTETTPELPQKETTSQTTVQTTPPETTAPTEEIPTESTSEITSETSLEPPVEDTPPCEDDHIITVDGTDYFVTSEYNTTAIGCYDEDNFLERFSSSYLDVEIVPGKTVIGGSTVYDNGTQVYITAHDGSWTYGPATVRNHHTGYTNSTLQLYFGSEEELAEFEAVNLSGCTVYEITTPKYAEPKTMEIDGEEYYVLDTLTGNMRTTSGSVDYGPTRPKLPDYGIYADPELIPEGSIVYVEGLGTTPWSYGPITTVVNVPNLGNYITIMISDDAEREALNDIHIYDSDNCTIRIISPEKPEAEIVPSQTQVSTYEYTGYNAQLPSEPPEYDNDVEIFLPPCSSPELYGYNGYGIEDLTFSFVPYGETAEKLKEFFCESALTPADEKDPSFTPDFYIDFNNGFVVAVWEESNYCEAAYYEYAGNASFRNHLFNESFADALSLRGKPYTFDEEVLELVAEIIEEATPDPEDFPDVEKFTPPEPQALPVELDKNWESVRSVTLAYPLYTWSNVREDYPVNYDFGTPCVTYTITDPEIVRQLIYCYHPDNLKPNVSTYRSYPDATLYFDNGYMVRFYIQYEYDFVAPCLYIGSGTYAVCREAEQYFSELFMTIE